MSLHTTASTQNHHAPPKTAPARPGPSMVQSSCKPMIIPQSIKQSIGRQAICGSSDWLRCRGSERQIRLDNHRTIRSRASHRGSSADAAPPPLCRPLLRVLRGCPSDGWIVSCVYNLDEFWFDDIWWMDERPRWLISPLNHRKQFSANQQIGLLKGKT